MNMAEVQNIHLRRWPNATAALLFIFAGAASGVGAAPPAQWISRGIGGGGAMYSPTINPSHPAQMAIAWAIDFSTVKGSDLARPAALAC